MDSNQRQTSIEKAVDKKNREEEEEESLAAAANKQKSPTSSPSVSAASPTSASSSPSHEFSFTISLHSSSSSSTTTTAVTDNHNTNNNNNNKTKTTPSSYAIDLSPADEIFFHGHLLPLRLLSHLPVSPRSSTNSLDSFTLPIKDIKDDQKPQKKFSNNIKTCHHEQMNSSLDQTKGRGGAKSKPFSLFGFAKWRKAGYEVGDNQEDGGDDKDQNNKQKKKLRFDDVSHAIKKYMRMVRPLLLFRGRRENGHHHGFQRQPYSFSGNLSFRKKQEEMIGGGGRRRRAEFSAPASIRTSPTNSGLLVANVPSSTSDSTMEELHAAIQAAIAHCKNSIAVEEKLRC